MSRMFENGMKWFNLLKRMVKNYKNDSNSLNGLDYCRRLLIEQGLPVSWFCVVNCLLCLVCRLSSVLCPLSRVVCPNQFLGLWLVKKRNVTLSLRWMSSTKAKYCQAHLPQWQYLLWQENKKNNESLSWAVPHSDLNWIKLDRFTS